MRHVLSYARHVNGTRILRPKTKKLANTPKNVANLAFARTFATTLPSKHGSYEWKDAKNEDEVVNIIYVDKQNNEVNIKGKVGDNAMYLAHRHKIEIEGMLILERFVDGSVYS